MYDYVPPVRPEWGYRNVAMPRISFPRHNILYKGMLITDRQRDNIDTKILVAYKVTCILDFFC